MIKIAAPENYKAVWLADEPQYIDTCAAWHFTAWGIKSSERTLQKDIKKFEISINKDKAPLTIVYIEEKRNVPVAMGSIWLNDSQRWPDHNPWITGIYVHEDCRNQGLAKSIMNNLETIAKSIGIPEIYLTASAATALYENLEYDVLEKREAPETPTGVQTLFSKKLRA